MKILYKRTNTGATQMWQILIDGNSYHTIEGQLNGKKITSKPTIVMGKNIGRSNETTPEEQALAEATSKWQKKIDKGYTENLSEIDSSKKFFEPMLAKMYLDYKDEIEFPVLVSTKIDGARMIAQKSGLWTRNGKPYVSCPHIQKILAPLFEEHPTWIVDGEIYSHSANFEKIMSLVKKTKPDKNDLIESEKSVQYYIFDGVVDDKALGFKERFELIKGRINKLVGKNKSIVFVGAEEVNSHEEIEKKHNEFVAQGFEGLMIRVPDSPYENKRSKYLLKYKKFFDEEYIVVDILEGKGQRSSMAGNVLLKTKDGKEFGAGIKGGEEYYKELLKNKKNYIGRKCTIRYQEKTELNIPRFPVVVQMNRFDV